LRQLLDVLGIDPDADELDHVSDAAPFIDLLLKTRERLRTAKQWAEADAIRDGLMELGITIADGPDGTTWRAEN
jgi:cysteinyl-tRNA synthetase